jgi:phosphomethylpyrimidine synthase
MCGPKFRSMKITQEVRDFAARQSSPAFAGEGDHPKGGGGATTTPTDRPEPVEGHSFSPGIEGKEGASTSSARTDMSDVEGEAEAGMAEMSEKFREKGGEIYLPAAE